VYWAVISIEQLASSFLERRKLAPDGRKEGRKEGSNKKPVPLVRK
jgi:hypothetical protein